MNKVKGVFFVLTTYIVIALSSLQTKYAESIDLESSTIEDDYIIDADGTLCEYKGTDSSIIIPDEVKRIGANSFSNNSSVTEVIIPEGVISIEENAFNCCYSLKDVSIPSTVRYIGNNAFHACDDITSITIPNGVQTIGVAAFSGCFNLQSISIPDSVNYIGESAFQYCYKLSSIEIPKDVKVINACTFHCCDSLSDVSIPEGVIDIEQEAFVSTHSLHNITLPSSLKYMGQGVFQDSGITSIKIPNGVKELEYDTFNSCKYLQEVELPEGMITIGSNAFKDCLSLDKITIPNSVTNLGTKVFDNCPLITKLNEDNPLFIMNSCVIDCYQDITDVVIPEGITTIGFGAFKEIKSLKSISIPSSVKTIEPYAFESCTNLVEVIFPEGLTTIGNDAFAQCTSLKNITIPSSVSDIKGRVFYGTPWLSEQYAKNPLVIINNEVIDGSKCNGDITIPEGVVAISETAFFGNKSINNVIFPKSLEVINPRAFEQSSLKNMQFNGENITIGSTAFLHTEWLSNLKNNKQLTVVKDILVNGNALSGTFSIPENIAIIDTQAFDWKSDNSSMTIPTNVTRINSEAFYASEFKDIIIENPQIILEARALDCNIDYISLPEGMEKIDHMVFCGADINKITIPKSVTYIEDSAFLYATIKEVYGYKGSYAEEYCNIYHIDFVAIDEQSKSGVVILYDYDSGEIIPNSQVDLNGITYKTDSCGCITIPDTFKDGIEIKMTGYDKLVLRDIPLESADPYPIGLTQDLSFEQPITKVIIKGVGRYRLFKSDLLKDEVSCRSDTSRKCNITVEADTNGKKISKYVIKQNNHIMFQNESGEFLNVEMKKFKPGARITALLVYADGTRSKQVKLLIHNYEVIRE